MENAAENKLIRDIEQLKTHRKHDRDVLDAQAKDIKDLYAAQQAVAEKIDDIHKAVKAIVAVLKFITLIGAVVAAIKGFIWRG